MKVALLAAFSLVGANPTDTVPLGAHGRAIVGAPRFHGQRLSHSLVADGDHLIVVVQGRRVVGCGAIPGMS